jgi:hypothetical protein
MSLRRLDDSCHTSRCTHVKTNTRVRVNRSKSVLVEAIVAIIALTVLVANSHMVSWLTTSSAAE